MQLSPAGRPSSSSSATHLDVGRPESVSLIFDRRITSKTPGTFRTKVITKGVDLAYSSLQATYDLRRLKRKGMMTTQS